MDLSTMEEKHEKDLYPTPEDFMRDAKLILDNFRKYTMRRPRMQRAQTCLRDSCGAR